MKVRRCLHASVYDAVLSNHPSKDEALHAAGSSSVVPQARGGRGGACHAATVAAADEWDTLLLSGLCDEWRC